MTTRICLLSSIVVLLFSCTSVKFMQPQPSGKRALSSFPKSLKGTWLETAGDSLFVLDKSFRYGNDHGPDFKMRGHLCADTILKKSGRDYLLNLKTDDGWEVILCKTGKELIDVYYIDLDKEKEKNIELIKKITEVKPHQNSTGDRIDYYLVNPSSSEMKKIIDSKVFVKKLTFSRIEKK